MNETELRPDTSSKAMTDAYDSFCEKVEAFASGVCVTEEQEQDLYDTVTERPISAWKLFKAGWDAAKQDRP